MADGVGEGLHVDCQGFKRDTHTEFLHRFRHVNTNLGLDLEDVVHFVFQLVGVLKMPFFFSRETFEFGAIRYRRSDIAVDAWGLLCACWCAGRCCLRCADVAIV